MKKSHAVSTVSFQAHAFSDGESIHLKLPGGLVSISSDAQQPNRSPRGLALVVQSVNSALLGS